MLALTLTFGLISTTAKATGDGLSQATAFTDLFDANAAADGWYWFNISGYSFRTQVKQGGHILVLHTYGNQIGALPEYSDMMASQSTHGILPVQALGYLTGLDSAFFEVVDPDIPNNNINVSTTNATILSRIAANQSLHDGVNDVAINADWNGPGQSHVRAATAHCTSTPRPLRYKVFHPCGDGLGTHLRPEYNYVRSSYVDGNISPTGTMSLWVKATSPVRTLSVTKLADKTVNVVAGEVITYTYEITNTSTVSINNVTIHDMHMGTGSFSQPNIDSATVTYDDPVATNDSTNGNTSNSVWDVLGPGDKIAVTATYTVTQEDIEELQ